MVDRAVHGSVRVGFVPNPTKSGFGKTHLPPTAGVNGSGGSDFNGCTDGSVGVKDLRK